MYRITAVTRCILLSTIAFGVPHHSSRAFLVSSSSLLWRSSSVALQNRILGISSSAQLQRRHRRRLQQSFQQRQMAVGIVSDRFSEQSHQHDDDDDNKDDSVPSMDDTIMNNNNDDETDTITTKVIHFNHAGASPSPSCVVGTVIDHIQLEQRIGGYAAQQLRQRQLCQVYNDVARLLHATSSYDNEIALVESATVGWTKLFYSMVDYQDKRQRQNKNKKNDSFTRTTTKAKATRNVILISEVEYAANVVAACHWARMTQHHRDDNDNHWTVRVIPSSIGPDGQSTGIVDLRAFREMIFNNNNNNNGDDSGSLESESVHGLVDPDDTIALVCVTHIPTNSGIVNPVADIGQIISQYNNKKRNAASTATAPPLPNDGGHQEQTDADADDEILYLVDACQSVGQMDVNVQHIQCHGLAATGRKYLRGPRGTGFLYVRADLVNNLMPSHLDHASAPVTCVPDGAYPPFHPTTAATTTTDANGFAVEDWMELSIRPGAKRFEFWESNIAAKLGLGRAVRYALDEVGLDHICRCCELLVSELTARLRAMNGINIHHESTCGIVTFAVRGVDATIVKDFLWTKQSKFDYRVEVSVVPATSTPLDSAHCKVPDLVRASVSYTTSLDDIEMFCAKLQTVVDKK